jgi:hypothetical protein
LGRKEYYSSDDPSDGKDPIRKERNIHEASEIPLEKSAIYMKHQILLLGKVETSIAIAPNLTARFI